MSGWWVHGLYETQGPAAVASWVFWVLLSIVLHELAHGWAALWQGDTTPRDLHRLTWNPLVHMGVPSLICFAVFGIAWGLMPVNPNRFRWGRRKGDIFVSLAGPAMNLALALVALSCLALWIRFGGALADEPLDGNLRLFFFFGGWLNLILFLFNLLPIPPLDGSRILAGVSRRAEAFYSRPEAMYFGLFVLAAIMFTPVGGAVFDLLAAIAQGFVGLFV